MASADAAPVEAAAPASGFLPGRIIHLHPTRLCNLACRHCYSESDPQRRSALDADALGTALTLLRGEGYAHISVSGGEPLVYPSLRAVVERARALGFRVTMVSNGLLVNQRNDALLSLFDAVAISFDGLAETHNAIRGRADAFQRAAQGLAHLAARGHRVSAAISITRGTIAELPELADHLVGLGAQGLQVRPVARAGRARGLADDAFLGAADHARLYLVMLALREELPAGVRLHCDLVPTQGLWQQRDAYAGLLADCATGDAAERPLAEMVNPLVITDAGVLKPIAYDFHGRFDIVPIGELSAAALRRYKQIHIEGLRALIGDALRGLQGRHELVDWFDHCTRLSERGSSRETRVQVVRPRPARTHAAA